MANYQYDEGGGMASFFILTFLVLLLFPMTFSSLFSSSKNEAEIVGCQCSPCLQKRDRLRKREHRSLLNPKLGFRSWFLICGWISFVFIVYRLAMRRSDTKMYDPFEILGISTGTAEKEIKSRYKQLSRQFHPDKVKLAVNQTIEEVESYFVEITKAYKSLTDETIRNNWEQFGHPDGRQEVSMGIAIPKWVVEGNSKYLVLLGYVIVIGGLLPVIIGRWWFGNTARTKDGVLAKTAEVFFKSIKEDSSMMDMLGCLGRAYELEFPRSKQATPLNELEDAIGKSLETKYHGPRQLTLLYAHLLRIPVQDSKLQKEQEKVLLRSPTLLTSLLNIAMAHNWLLPTVNAMRLQAFLAQAILPSASSTAVFSQLPNMTESDAALAVEELDEISFKALLEYLQSKDDARKNDVEKATEKWGQLELVDAAFKVIGERIVTPQAIVQLLIKLRISPPLSDNGSGDKSKSEEAPSSGEKSLQRKNDEKDMTFLSGRADSEAIAPGLKTLSYAHAPYWPATRRPGWWIMITDTRVNRLVMPPLKITDVPLSDPSNERNYRAYKIQFQAPNVVSTNTWTIRIVSDSFIGEEIARDITLKVEDVSKLTAEEQAFNDDISDPEEDSLAGQMALMRGGAVKKSKVYDDSDDESSLDEESDEKSSDSSSDSD